MRSDTQPKVIEDCYLLIGREIAEKSGVSGTAVKLAYKTVETYLAKRGEEVSEALLSVTDARAAASGRPAVIKAYRTVRGGAVKHVEAALPHVGDLVLNYAA